MQLSIVIPTYKSPETLDLCLKSIIENQVYQNEIIVVVDGFYDLNKEVLDKFKDKVSILNLPNNMGMIDATNLGLINCKNEWVLIINDDNILPYQFDKILLDEFLGDEEVLTINQIEPKPSIYSFDIKDFGTPTNFLYNEFIKYEKSIRNDEIDLRGGIFPFLISKKNYMKVGGFDAMYFPCPFVVDFDFFLKLDLCEIKFRRTHKCNFYHFGSMSTKNNKEQKNWNLEEQMAAEKFYYKWGITPQLFENNSHRPKGQFINGIHF